MKKIQKYQCEVCNSVFETELLALNCENKGIEQSLTKENEFVQIKTEYNQVRTGRVVSVETNGHKNKYTIGLYPQTNGLHFQYETTCTLLGNVEFQKKAIIKQ